MDFANHVYDAAIEKYTKVLYTRKQGGELPMIVAAANENMQSKFIVEKILDLNEQGVNLQEIAVLFRSSFFSFDVQQCMFSYFYFLNMLMPHYGFSLY